MGEPCQEKIASFLSTDSWAGEILRRRFQFVGKFFQHPALKKSRHVLNLMRGSNVKPGALLDGVGEPYATMTATGTGDAAAILAVVRKILLAVLTLGIAGSITELILLKHSEDLRQWIPLVLLAVALPTLAWHWLSASALSTHTMRWLMLGFVMSGLVGVYFHFQGSAEFKLESNPSLSGMALFWEAIGGKAPPLLAPGAMIQLGLLGLVYTLKHPALSGPDKKGE